jgi:hypothetical protein
LIHRLTSDGQLDPAFASMGVLTLDGMLGHLLGVTLDPAGRIVAVGKHEIAGVDHPLIVRVRADRPGPDAPPGPPEPPTARVMASMQGRMADRSTGVGATWA